MNKIILLLLPIFLSSIFAFAQNEPKKDSTIALKNDDYSNFRRSNKVSPHSGTIDYDTSGQKVKTKLIAFDYQKMTNEADLQYKKNNFTKLLIYTRQHLLKTKTLV